MKNVTCKLGNMRKAKDWTVYPRKDGERCVIQTSDRIAAFDPETGKGLLSKAVASGAYFLHLSPALGATPIVVPAEIVAEVIGATPKPGEEIGPGVIVG